MSLDAHLRSIAFGKLSKPNKGSSLLDELRSSDRKDEYTHENRQANKASSDNRSYSALSVNVSTDDLWTAAEQNVPNGIQNHNDPHGEKEVQDAKTNIRQSVSLLLDVHRFSSLETTEGESDNSSLDSRVHHSTIVVIAERAAALKEYVAAKDAISLYFLSLPPQDQVRNKTTLLKQQIYAVHFMFAVL